MLPLSGATKTFKSPLRKKKVVLPQSPAILEVSCQVSFRSILRIRPLLGSETEEHDNNILAIDIQETETSEQKHPKTPFNSPFPKFDNPITSTPVGCKGGANHLLGNNATAVVLKPPNSALSFPTLPFPTSTANAKTCVKSVKKYAAVQLNAIAGTEDKFQFDYVFDKQCTQHEFYEAIGSGIVSDAIAPLLISGERSGEQRAEKPTQVVFSLGVTNSGKTYTLFGKSRDGGPESGGLVVLMIEHLFSFFDEDKNNLDSRGVFGITISMIELHNEQVHDMLETSNKTSNMRSASPLRIHQHTESETFFIPGLTYTSFNTETAARIALFDAMKTAQVRATPQNENSSRSHIIITIQPTLKLEEKEKKMLFGGKIMIFDLAGVERTKKSDAVGVPLKESISINSSIKAVMSCLRTLKWNQEHPEKKKIVPYRESKITMLLQPLFSGKSGAVVATMIVSAYPGATDYAEKKYLLKEVSALRSLTVTEGVTEKLKEWITNTPVKSPYLRMPLPTSTSKEKKVENQSIENIKAEREALLLQNLELKRQCEDLKVANSSLRQLLKEAHKNKTEYAFRGELYNPETEEAKASRHRLQALVPSPLKNHIIESLTNDNQWTCVPNTQFNKAPFQLTVPYQLESDEYKENAEVQRSKCLSDEKSLDAGTKRLEACVSTRDKKKIKK